jgi:hypothetical protein
MPLSRGTILGHPPYVGVKTRKGVVLPSHMVVGVFLSLVVWVERSLGNRVLSTETCQVWMGGETTLLPDPDLIQPNSPQDNKTV